MFVARYPDWTAAVRFTDGSMAWFDGAKDLFRFLAEPGRYSPARSPADVKEVLVTDYYAVQRVDARVAWFVLGSDVFGPMGKELVPFAKRSDAEEFSRDHHGSRILRFAEVGRDLLARLD
jgi:nitrous oxide reductase accessory protein NosL